MRLCLDAEFKKRAKNAGIFDVEKLQGYFKFDDEVDINKLKIKHQQENANNQSNNDNELILEVTQFCLSINRIANLKHLIFSSWIIRIQKVISNTLQITCYIDLLLTWHLQNFLKLLILMNKTTSMSTKWTFMTSCLAAMNKDISQHMYSKTCRWMCVPF